MYNSKRLDQPLFYSTAKRPFKIPEIIRSYKNSRSPPRRLKAKSKSKVELAALPPSSNEYLNIRKYL